MQDFDQVEMVSFALAHLLLIRLEDSSQLLHYYQIGGCLDLADSQALP